MQAFFDAVRPIFNGRLSQPQVAGIEAIVAATDGLPIEQRAYILATAAWETAWTMQPVRETLADTDQAAVQRLEVAYQRGRLPTVKTPYWRFDADGKTWLGRGYVQLTHKANYERAGRELDVDLVGNPDLAMQPTVAARILVRGSVEGWFTGKKLGDYLPGDYVNARRVINGDVKAHGGKIARTAGQFEAALKLLEPVRPNVEPVAPAKPPAGWLAALVAILARLLKR